MRSKLRPFVPFLETQKIYERIKLKEKELDREYRNWTVEDKVLFLLEENIIERPLLDPLIAKEIVLVKKKNKGE